jgi:flagellar M-ring protein FliF
LISPLIRDARGNLTVDTSGRIAAIQREITIPEAAVFLTLAPNVTLSNDQILGIQNHVAASVPGLVPDKVSIQDNFFNPLRGEESIITILDHVLERIELANILVNTFRTNLNAALFPVFGVNSVTVTPYVTLNWTEEEIESIIFHPVVDGEGIVVAMESMNERANAMTPPARVEGMDSNGGAPIYPEIDPSQTMNYSRSVMNTNLEVSQVLTRINREQGNITKLTIAVAIDGDPEEWTLSDYNLAQRLVAAAIGLTDPDVIADSVVVYVRPFQERIRQEELMGQAFSDMERQRMMDLIQSLVPAVLIFIALLVVILQTFGLLPASFADIDEMTLDEEALRAKNLREKLEEIINSNPAMAAELLRNWLSADDHW